MSRLSFDYCQITLHDDLVVDLIFFPVHFSRYQSLSTTLSVLQKLSSRLKFRLFLEILESTKHVAPRSSLFPKTPRLRPLKKEGERKSASERETERAHERENERSAHERENESARITNERMRDRRSLCVGDIVGEREKDKFALLASSGCHWWGGERGGWGEGERSLAGRVESRF